MIVEAEDTNSKKYEKIATTITNTNKKKKQKEITKEQGKLKKKKEKAEKGKKKRDRKPKKKKKEKTQKNSLKPGGKHPNSNKEQHRRHYPTIQMLNLRQTPTTLQKIKINVHVLNPSQKLRII
ncbi:hypothetical protein ACEE78_12235 [Staphylococcus hyicus]